VECGTVFREGEFPKGGLLLNESEIVTTDGEGTGQGGLTEAERELNEGEAGAAAICFRLVGARVKAKDWARARC
jgi:hypothetical protein